MKPMTPEQRGEARFYVPPGQNPAAPELVAHVACGARALEITTTDPDTIKLARDMTAVIWRLLTTEQQAEALRSVLAEAVALAADLPDDGLTAGDLLRLLTARGLDLTQDIADAETLREAHALAGV
jgi:hypothetical protein